MNISLVFKISDLTEYYEGGDEDKVAEAQLSILVASPATKETEEIWDSHVGKSIRNKTFE